jgi:hypothetical protein
MAHSLSTNSRSTASTASLQSQNTAQDEQIPTGIVGARIQQFKTIANHKSTSEFSSAAATHYRESTRLG